MPHWSFRVADVKESVKNSLPDHWKLRSVEVTSGDSGKKYWIAVLWDEERRIVLTTCQCNEGYFNIPLTVTGDERKKSLSVADGGKACCKHVENYLAFREEKKS